VESRALYEVDLESGARHFGSLQAAPEPDRLAVRDTEGRVASLPVPETIRITPLDTTGSVKNLLDGYVDFGFSYSDATSVNQLSMAAGVSRRDFHRLSSLDFSLVGIRAARAERFAGSRPAHARRRGLRKIHDPVEPPRIRRDDRPRRHEGKFRRRTNPGKSRRLPRRAVQLVS